MLKIQPLLLLQQCLLLFGISDFNTEEGLSPKNLLIFIFWHLRVFQISVQFQIMQSAIYNLVATHVLTPAILSLDSLRGIFSFAEYKRTKTWQDIILAMCMFHVCIFFKGSKIWLLTMTVCQDSFEFIVVSLVEFHSS